MEPVIRVEGLSKAYRLGSRQARADTLAEALGQLVRAPAHNFSRLRRLDTFSTGTDAEDILWALKDLAFTVSAGEVLGFVGRNGAGKSTLLKILSRITDPTAGRVLIRGRVSSLLEVGTGFHPELTGRENVYMNGTILGMRKREIDRKFDEIVAFSGVERFLDTPVKRYSSGMKVRLGFSVAAHLEPEVLIVDEVLAVGDADFQRRCLGKMQHVAGLGRTVLFVSHNLGVIENLCTRAISLEDGQMLKDGATSEVIQDYLGRMNPQDCSGFGDDNPLRDSRGPARFIGGRILNDRGEATSYVQSGAALTFELDYVNPTNSATLEPALSITNPEGVPVFHLSPRFTGTPLDGRARGRLRCTLPKLALPVGDYRVKAILKAGSDPSDSVGNAFVFSVRAPQFFPTGAAPPRRFGSALAEHEWQQISAANDASSDCAAAE
ncbi:MAG: ABC transporter ATP-binding protein [Rhodothalassiaceae bacterium]